ncbi:UNKNOWN [Stylonychia lemnae]|uniref:LITAF domain-containing protein n=1 Tax=Stylonychia lemnae TaxID=5949 RepID=A0A078ABW7_STYLE|nr:UNKNOWN [Stylonychia lemnae]|eukprot:CDW79694.1 UNKNOWN [Stylonychia lemnae]
MSKNQKRKVKKHLAEELPLSQNKAENLDTKQLSPQENKKHKTTYKLEDDIDLNSKAKLQKSEVKYEKQQNYLMQNPYMMSNQKILKDLKQKTKGIDGDMVMRIKELRHNGSLFKKRQPAILSCYNCDQTLYSITKQVPSPCQVLTCFLLFGTVIASPCAFVPFYFEEFYSYRHFCGSCGRYLGDSIRQ